jgi:GNAT superfamily N-acetyltransferase
MTVYQAPAAPAPPIDTFPLTPDRWPDLETLFGPRGACAGCWCMCRRLAPATFKRDKGAPNRASFQALVHTAPMPPGLLAYAGSVPVGWCAVAPREDYPRLERSCTLARVDDAPVWAITCFFTAPAYRRGVTRRLLIDAARYAADRGPYIVEGYPIDPSSPNVPAVFAWIGFVSVFRQAGFVESARRSPSRPIMRYYIIP